ncbi:MAG: hypothetical protein AAFP17_15100 [Pseudomonadota bacterium]
MNCMRLAAALLAAVTIASPAAAIVYTVDLSSGSTSITGTFDLNATGDFNRSEFEAATNSFSLTLNVNGIIDTITDANANDNRFGASSSTFSVTPTEIVLFSPSDATLVSGGGNFSDLFYRASDDTLGVFIGAASFIGRIPFSSEFVLATAPAPVPLPAPALLLMSGLGALWLRRRLSA